MEYLLLIADRRGEPPRAEVGADEMAKFARELAEAGVLRGAAGPLAPEAEAACVRVREGRAEVVDGPFAGSTEVVRGFFAVEVPDRAAALELAKRCPYARAGLVEVHAAERGGERRPATGAPQFLLLYRMPPDPRRGGEGLRERMRVHLGELRQRGDNLESARLPGQIPAGRVELRAGRALVVDGPFAETKEVVGGYSLLEAASRAAAIELAKGIPHAAWGAIEVREVTRRGAH